LEEQFGQFLVGRKCAVGRGIVVQEQDYFDEFPATYFNQNILQLNRKRYVKLRTDILAFWKVINEDDAVLIQKNQGENFSSGFLHSELFRFGVSRYAAIPLIAALSPGHCDITRFH